MLTRRSAFKAAAGLVVASAVGAAPAFAADKVVKVGLDMSFTGADSTDAVRMANGGILAFEEANKSHEVPGIIFRLEKYDDGTATAGQYDPAQAATNARKMVSDRAVLAAIGPQMSGAGKAMAPILSAGNLAIITPASTNPDITDPKYAAQYRPAGKPVYFRTVATDAYQGPNMANYMAQTLRVKSVYVLDDSGAYGVGLADAFQKQAEKIGLKLLGRDRLDPKAADYAAVLTKIKSLGPDALYFGGVGQAGVKLAKQAYEIIPNVIKAGGDGMQSTDLLAAAGFPAVEGLVRHARRTPRHRRSEARRVHQALQRAFRHAAGRFRGHLLCRRPRHYRGGEGAGGEQQGGDACRGARRHPGDQHRGFAARPDRVRRERRFEEQDHQRVSGQAGRYQAARQPRAVPSTSASHRWPDRHGRTDMKPGQAPARLAAG